jgi:hypothetical protein
MSKPKPGDPGWYDSAEFLRNALLSLEGTDQLLFRDSIPEAHRIYFQHLKRAIEERETLRRWQEQAADILGYLDNEDLRDEDGDCIFCWQSRKDGHLATCASVRAHALLSEGESH